MSPRDIGTDHRLATTLGCLFDPAQMCRPDHIEVGLYPGSGPDLFRGFLL